MQRTTNLLSLSFLLLAAACAPESALTDTAEDVEASDEQRDPIVGGQTTNAFPAVGALTRFGSTHCTATVIAPRKLLTAAHCLKGFTASSMKFVLGGSVSAPTHTLSVASITPHPQYNESTLTNDIGIVTLASDAPVPPMKLLPSMDQSFVGKELLYVGYGVSNGVNQTGAGTKRYVRMPTSQVMTKQFRYQTAGKNTCNGDSGGPAFAEINGELLLAGVTSYGDANCTQYGVDTRADAFKDFMGLPAQDPCGGETFAGRCDGQTVVWCENQQVKSTSCSSQNKVCGFSAQNQYYACIDQAAADPCGGETFAGRCDGNKLIWCENQQVKNVSCSNQCGFNTAQGYYDCI